MKAQCLTIDQPVYFPDHRSHKPSSTMSSIIYIPASDPFAIFGIILLLLLIAVSLYLLIFTARRSAEDARRAVHDQARYQRLLQLHRREERNELKKMEEGRVNGARHPSRIVTVPSASSSVCSAAPSAEPSRAGPTFKASIQLPTDTNTYTVATSLTGIGECQSDHWRPVERLPRSLRVGRQSTKSQRQPKYQPVCEEDPES